MTPEERARKWYAPAGDVPPRILAEFAAEIRAAVEEEREACAVDVFNLRERWIDGSGARVALREAASLIRARGKA